MMVHMFLQAYLVWNKLLVQPVEQKQTTHIVTGQILDWSFTYGAEPSIFIATELAW